jgi:hypothetical protein
VLLSVYSHPDAPRYFQGIHGPVSVVDQDRLRGSLQADLLVQLSNCARGHILAGLARTGGRSPRPVALPGGAAVMHPVQQQILPPIGGAARDNYCGSVRTVTADWLAVLCGELSRAAEVSHVLILADPGAGADSRVAVWVAVQHGTAPFRKDRPAAVVQLEPIGTAAPQAANAVGVRALGLRAASRL